MLVGIGAAAFEAGIRPGDVIMEFNGRPVDDASQFQRQLSDAEIGTTAPIKLMRRGREVDLRVRVSGADVRRGI